MKVLFIGGTGVISSACSQLAVDQGIELYLLNRNQSIRRVPESAYILRGDIHDQASLKSILDGKTFDVVVDWIAFNPDHIEADLELFKGKIRQYIFISSASVYQTPPKHLPIAESTPLDNPYWEYSQMKIACEERLMKAYREEQFPVTIVRPSHTYDQTSLPVYGRYTIVDRMKKGKKVIVHGDGASLWVLTHHQDFAKGFNGLLGNEKTIGEAFHITSDELLTWNQIYQMIADAAGTNVNIVHIPSDVIAKFDKEWGANLLGDKSHSMVFDNSKIKQYVPDFKAMIPFSKGVKEIISWFNTDKSRQVINEEQNRLFDKIIEKWESGWE